MAQPRTKSGRFRKRRKAKRSPAFVRFLKLRGGTIAKAGGVVAGGVGLGLGIRALRNRFSPSRLGNQAVAFVSETSQQINPLDAPIRDVLRGRARRLRRQQSAARIVAQIPRRPIPPFLRRRGKTAADRDAIKRILRGRMNKLNRAAKAVFQ